MKKDDTSHKVEINGHRYIGFDRNFKLLFIKDKLTGMDKQLSTIVVDSRNGYLVHNRRGFTITQLPFLVKLRLLFGGRCYDQ